jgi:hypothetical protein
MVALHRVSFGELETRRRLPIPEHRVPAAWRGRERRNVQTREALLQRIRAE